INRSLGYKEFELDNHLGNVIGTVSDRKVQVYTVGSATIDSYSPDLLSETDYYAFGQNMPGRNWAASTYHYNYQKQEKDPELWNGAIVFKFRIEDPRIGRFFSIDPLAAKYPFLTPYSFSGNRIMDAVEVEGKEPDPLNYVWTGFGDLISSAA